jgi:plastocyanin
MFVCWIRKPAILGLGLSATLAALVAGCGGQPTDSSEINVVVPDPSVNVAAKTSPASSPGAAPSTGSAPAASNVAPGATAAPSKAEGWGTFKGQVVFEGTPPPVKILEAKGKAEKDPEMCAVDSDIKSERLVIDDATKGVKNVLVYLPRPTAVNEEARKAFTAKPVEFDQKHCVFEPHVLGLMAGVPVTLKSSDPKNHNVNVKLKNSTFNQALGAGKTLDFTPASPERTPGAVVCDIHPWMSAWWMVLENPYIAVTDAKGNFEIKNVPAGTQKVVVWQEMVKGGGFVTASSGDEVTIKANDPTVQTFKIDSSKLLPGG